MGGRGILSKIFPDWRKDFFCVLILFLSVLLVYLVGGMVIVFASLIVIFDRCLFGRVKIISGIEFSTLAVVMVAMKYDLVVSVLFCALVVHILPAAINMIIGEKFIINKAFKMVRLGFGAIVTFTSVLVIYFLKELDILIVVFIVLVFAHILYTVKGKIMQTNYVLNCPGIIVNFLFNIALVLFFYPVLVQLLV
ncbi:MAG: hypothetical protein KAU95_02005 [Candidatus Aenigmarchaeota archaeon]|nr:hypothetical protein [Candidatus Aenigmarchaeota archaeon]